MKTCYTLCTCEIYLFNNFIALVLPDRDVESSPFWFQRSTLAISHLTEPYSQEL